jgi:hypothetical protein
MVAGLAEECRTGDSVSSSCSTWSYEKARYSNLQNLRKQRKEATGALDKRTIQAALGKCQPRQRMWGVSGKLVLGVRITKTADQLQAAMLKLLQDLEVAELFT